MFRLATLAGTLAIAGCATGMDADADRDETAAANQARDCFFVRNITGFRGLDDDSVIIEVGVNDYYQLDAFGTCNQLDWAHRMAVISDVGGTMCAGEISPGRIVTEEENCRIDEITRVYPDEEDVDDMEDMDEADAEAETGDAY